MDRGAGGPQALLETPSRGDATDDRARIVIGERGLRSGNGDLGDLVLALLAGTLAGLRDRLYDDGYPSAGDVVADLVEVTDGYLGMVDRA
jgi:hypothetical protein